MRLEGCRLHGRHVRRRRARRRVHHVPARHRLRRLRRTHGVCASRAADASVTTFAAAVDLRPIRLRRAHEQRSSCQKRRHGGRRLRGDTRGVPRRVRRGGLPILRSGLPDAFGHHVPVLLVCHVIAKCHIVRQPRRRMLEHANARARRQQLLTRRRILGSPVQHDVCCGRATAAAAIATAPASAQARFAAHPKPAQRPLRDARSNLRPRRILVHFQPSSAGYVCRTEHEASRIVLSSVGASPAHGS